MRIGNRNVLGTLLHITRFYTLRLPKLLDLIKRLIQILKVTSKFFGTYGRIFNKLLLYRKLLITCLITKR
jgi:hypothetical protein